MILIIQLIMPTILHYTPEITFGTWVLRFLQWQAGEHLEINLRWAGKYLKRKKVRSNCLLKKVPSKKGEI